MSTSSRPRRALFIPFALITSAALLLTACGSGTDDGSDTQAAAASQKIPTTDVVSSLKTDASAAKLLPAGTDSLNLAVSVGGTPPGTSYLEDGKTLAGQDVDFAAAVAKVLGIKLKREAASFEAILPALDSGKYDVGVGNFGVTDERRRTIDFVTYINDGQGFATRKDSKLDKVTDLAPAVRPERRDRRRHHLRGHAGGEQARVLRRRQEGVQGADLQRAGRHLVLAPAGPQRHRDEHDQRPALRRRPAGGAASSSTSSTVSTSASPSRRAPSWPPLPGRGEQTHRGRHVRPDPQEVGHDAARRSRSRRSHRRSSRTDRPSGRPSA